MDVHRALYDGIGRGEGDRAEHPQEREGHPTVAALTGGPNMTTGCNHEWETFNIE
jgi:hypothetical protein